MTDFIFIVFVLLLIFVVIGLIVTNIRIVPQANAYVIERLGNTCRPGRPDYISRFLWLIRLPKRYR